MSLFSALNNSLSGLKANQVALDIVSRNVANASTPGYTKKVAPRENAILANDGSGVRILPTAREVNTRLLENLRAETSRSARLDTVSDYLTRVDEMFGRPDQETSVAYAVNELALSMGELVDNPENAGVRKAVIAQADMVTRELNQLSGSIQDMRTEAERGLATAVGEVNTALKAIEELNVAIANRTAGNLTTADLEDRRDIQLMTVARNLDIRVVERPDGAMTVFTNSGHTLVGERASQFAFDSREVLSSSNAYSTVDANRTVGTLTLVSAGGTTVDILQDGPPRQGTIAGLLELRDERLPEAQAQLDEMAHTLALAMADRVTQFQSTTAGARSLDFTDSDQAATTHANGTTDILPIKDGDRMVVEYTQNGVAKKLTAYFVETSYNNDLTNRVPDPDNSVFVDINGLNAGLPMENAGLADRIMTAFNNSSLAVTALFSTPTIPAAGAGDVLNATAGTASLTISAISMRQATETAVDGPALNLFADGNSPAIEQRAYTGNLSDDPWQKVGFAARIGVTNAIAEDDTLLVRYETANGQVAAGDNSRGRLMLDRMTEDTYVYSPDTGLGDPSYLYQGTMLDLGRAVVSYQGQEARSQQSLSTDQAARTELLSQRNESLTGVNVDDELAQLILLQSAYAASAKVVQTVDRLFEDLLSLR